MAIWLGGRLANPWNDHRAGTIAGRALEVARCFQHEVAAEVGRTTRRVERDHTLRHLMLNA